VTGEKIMLPQVQKIEVDFGKKWVSTGKREISFAVRLDGTNRKYE
jgi:hypothetical protein